jgi:hypothetical protein
MKWNMTVKDLTSISICIAIAVVLGKVLGMLHGVLPFSRGIVNAPFYSFLMAVMLYRTKKPGTMTLFALGYGGIMIGVSSIFMSIAVIIGGILGDLMLLLIVRKYDSNWKIALCAPIYSAGGMFGTFIVVTYLTESVRYVFQGPLALIISIVAVYLIGLSGSLLAMKIMPSKLEASTCYKRVGSVKSA